MGDFLTMPKVNRTELNETERASETQIHESSVDRYVHRYDDLPVLTEEEFIAQEGREALERLQRIEEMKTRARESGKYIEHKSELAKIESIDKSSLRKAPVTRTANATLEDDTENMEPVLSDTRTIEEFMEKENEYSARVSNFINELKEKAVKDGTLNVEKSDFAKMFESDNQSMLKIYKRLIIKSHQKKIQRSRNYG